MTLVIKSIIGAILLLKSLSTFTPAPDYSSEGFVGVGIGLRGPNLINGIFVINAGYKRKISNHTYFQYKCGYFDSNVPNNKYKSSFFAFAGPGLEVDLNPFEARFHIGLGTIVSIKKQLGSPFPQFNEDFYVGIKDKEDNSIGLQYEHMSNGGLKSPNPDRNFLITRLGRKW